MKKLFILLAMIAGASASSSAQANPEDQTTRHQHSRVLVRASRPQARTVYYITSNTVAGSHIPTVVRQYKGENEGLNGGFLPDRFFNGGALNRANGTSIGGSLAQLDPAITVH